MAEHPLPTAGTTTAELAFALCHEIANLVGAIRMHAHLVDARMTPRELARASVEIDDLCARSSALLAHFRPLLDEAGAITRAAAPLDLVNGLRDVMSHHGGRGTQLDFEAADGLAPIAIDQEVLHYVLQSLLFAGLEATGGRGTVGLSVQEGHGAAIFAVDDDGPVDEDPSAWRRQAARGRPLVCAVADAIVGRRGGSVEVTRDGGRTRVSIRIPTQGGATS